MLDAAGGACMRACVAYAHVKTPNGRAHPLALIVKSSAVTIVPGCVARSRSVAFHVSTRVACVPLSAAAASRDNFAVCIAAIMRARTLVNTPVSLRRLRPRRATSPTVADI